MRNHPHKGNRYHVGMVLYLKRKVEMQMVNKKILALFLCVFLGLPLAACSGSNTQETPQGVPETQNVAEDSSSVTDTQAAVDNNENNSQEGLADLDLTDEELLEALGDNIHVVSNDDYIQTVTDFKENSNNYIGQIYQLEGVFAKDGYNLYVMREADESGSSRLPLKYVADEPEENTNIRVTGIVNLGEVDGETVTVLDVAVIETL